MAREPTTRDKPPRPAITKQINIQPILPPLKVILCYWTISTNNHHMLVVTDNG